MGIPTFYRYITKKWPSVSIDVNEERPNNDLPVDTTRPNPNGVEFDNLYIDLNGIIHPCFHPDGNLAFETYEDVFVAIYQYIDRIFSIVRPRKLLFLAIDGVAPRAKLNHQRARRFKTAKETAEQAATTEGNKANPRLMQKMDANIITPGTEFMELLSSALKYYIHLKMNQDPGWKGLKVILSDSNVPGEGEQKIMSFIRLQRNLPGYDPNTHHCLYGLDADLILLALASHEIHFTILREIASKSRRRYLKHDLQKAKDASEQMEAIRKDLEELIQNQTFVFLKIWVLRQCIVKDLTIKHSRLKLDEERLIDDFVLMCLFVGNDFLPRLPSLEVSKGAVSQLMKIYSQEFFQTGGYLTNSFEVNLERVEHMIKVVGSLECETGQKKIKREKFPIQQARKRNTQSGVSSPVESGTLSISQDPIDQNGSEVQPIVDKIRIGEEGWKKILYAENFEAKTEDECEQVRRHAVSKYIEGICWIMRYFYEGVCSWQWFYPYYYAPPASDFDGVSKLEIHFTLGEPFKPFDQLMAVMPAASAHAVPACYRKLLTDPSSPILDFYPIDYEVDMSGTDVKWMGICKLPFIEESRLLSELSKVENLLTCKEKQRNVFGMDILYLHFVHPLTREIISFFQRKDNHSTSFEKILEIDPKYSDGMNGSVYLHNKITLGNVICSPIPWLNAVSNNQVISVLYKFPEFHPHIPRLPTGVILSEMVSIEQLPKKIQKRGNNNRQKYFDRVLKNNRQKLNKSSVRMDWKTKAKWKPKKEMNNSKKNSNQTVGISHEKSDVLQNKPNRDIADGIGAKKKEETKQEVKSKKRERSPTKDQQQKGDSAKGVLHLEEVKRRKKNRTSKKTKLAEGVKMSDN